MLLKTTLLGKTYAFRDLKDVLAKANEEKTGDKLAGLAAENARQRIAAKVVRFHVLANSDSEEDQRLKLRVKETVLEMVRPMLEGVESKQEAVEILQKNMEEIEAEADKVILEEGYDYQSKGILGKTTFPIKQYGDMVFPAGEYEAFRILLGDAKGKN